jgi:quinol monooxygenase YgiN
MKTLIGAFAALSLLVAGAAWAEPVYTVTYIEVAPDKTESAAQALRAYGARSRAEPGGVELEALHRIERANHFALLEAWTDQPARDAHAAGPASKALNEALAPLLSAPVDERPHTALSVGVSPAPKPDRLLVLTHVDFIPTQKEVGVELLRDLVEQSRAKSGAARFDALTQNSRPNHLTIVETWNTLADKDRHTASGHVRAFRDRLLSLSGSLYDERLYRPLGGGS